jgi:hypothetical protein
VLYELPPWVAKEVERKIEFVHHISIATRRVDADAGNSDTAFLELFVIPGKADQLPVAVRSPIASVEDKHQGAIGKLPAQVERFSLFVRYYEGREPRPNHYVRHVLLLSVL